MSKTNKLSLRCAKENEMIYTFAQSQQLYMQTGCIGYLRGDFGHGNAFYTSWFDTAPFRKTPEFQSEFNEVITAFRDDSQYRGILHNLEDMKMLCATRPQSKMPDRLREYSYAFRADTQKHTYLLRLFPFQSDYNFYIYAYQREHFERHLEKAASGIRFITPDYKEKFRIPDGDQILITTSNGEKTTRTCRYIDDYHLEVGNNLYHICEFAEKMEQAGNTVIPQNYDDKGRAALKKAKNRGEAR